MRTEPDWRNWRLGLARNLFVPHKFDYARGKRPKVSCIFCEVVAGKDTVERLEVHRTDRFLISLNLYPYNPGHLILFPVNHCTHPRELKDSDVQELHHLQLKAMQVLDSLYQPRGFNVGYNLGQASGASIEHLHIHIVPRYERELGFMDIIGGAKIMVEDPVRSRDRIRNGFNSSR